MWLGERFTHLTIPELSFRLSAELGQGGEGSAVERAIRELVRSGLLRMDGGRVIPGRADAPSENCAWTVGSVDSRLMAATFAIGTRYERPPAEPASWFHDVLEQVRSERDGDVPIRVEATTGHRVDGLLGEADPAISPGPHGKVSLNSHGEDLVIGSEMIAAFTLLPGRSATRDDEPSGS